MKNKNRKIEANVKYVEALIGIPEREAVDPENGIDIKKDHR